MNIDLRLAQGLDKMGLKVPAEIQSALIRYVQLMHKWNKAYNLTAIRDQDQMVSEAGIGSMELHTWIAASAAHLACGGRAPEVKHYSVALEIGIAAGIVCAD